MTSNMRDRKTYVVSAKLVALYCRLLATHNGAAPVEWRGRLMTTNTIRLPRVLRASPERIYRAFLEPAVEAKWRPAHRFTAGWRESLALLALLVGAQVGG